MREEIFTITGSAPGKLFLSSSEGAEWLPLAARVGTGFALAFIDVELSEMGIHYKNTHNCIKYHSVNKYFTS